MHSPIVLLIFLLPSIQVHAGETNSTDYTITTDILPNANQSLLHNVSDGCGAEVEVPQEVDEFIENTVSNITLMEYECDSELNYFFGNLSILISENTTKYQEFIIKLLPKYMKCAENVFESIKAIELYIVCSKSTGKEAQLLTISELRQHLDFVITILHNLNNYINYSQSFFVTRKETVNEFINIYKTSQLIRTLETEYYHEVLTMSEEPTAEELKIQVHLDRKIIETISYIIDSINNLENREATDLLYNQTVLTSKKDKMDVRQTWELKRQKWNQYLSLDERFYEVESNYESFMYLVNNVQPIVLGVVFVIGSLENAVLVLVFIMNKNMRTARNFSVINLTIADIFSLAVNAFLFIFIFKKYWAYGNELCKIFKFCEQFSLALNIYSVMLISVQRFLAVTNICEMDISNCVQFNTLAPYLPIAIIWIISAILASQNLWFVVDTESDKRFCRMHIPDEYLKEVSILRFLFYCIVPLVIIVGTSLITSYRIRHSIKNIPGEAQGLKAAIKARALSFKIVLALTVVSVISNFPYFIIELYGSLWYVPGTDSLTSFLYADSFARAMLFLNSCFNPIALYLMSRVYRTHMNVYVTCGLARRIRNPNRVVVN